MHRPINHHEQAQAIADHLCAASLADLQARLDAAQADLRAWIAAYAAAIDQADAHAIDPLMTVTEIAEALSCSKSVVYNLIRSNQLPAVTHFGDLKRVRQADVLRLMGGGDAEPTEPPRRRQKAARKP